VRHARKHLGWALDAAGPSGRYFASIRLQQQVKELDRRMFTKSGDPRFSWTRPRMTPGGSREAMIAPGYDFHSLKPLRGGRIIL
jgi:hypothetical protein